MENTGTGPTMLHGGLWATINGNLVAETDKLLKEELPVEFAANLPAGIEKAIRAAVNQNQAMAQMVTPDYQIAGKQLTPGRWTKKVV